MKKYKFLMAFFACWIASSLTFLGLDLIWPAEVTLPIASLLGRTFLMSLIIVILPYAILRSNKRNSV